MEMFEAISECALPPMPPSDGPDEPERPTPVQIEARRSKLKRLLPMLKEDAVADDRLLAAATLLAREAEEFGLDSDEERLTKEAIVRAVGFDPLRDPFPPTRDPSSVFVETMEILHAKLNKDAWKRHPAALRCYRFMLNEWSGRHRVRCPHPLIFPAVFLQLDDHEPRHRMRGFECCHSALTNIETPAEQSGYESVIYDCLAKYVRHPEEETVEGSLRCLTALLPRMVPTEPSAKWSRTDDLIEQLLEGLALDADNKKKIYWKQLNRLMERDANAAIRWKKKFLMLLIDSLELELSDASSFKYEALLDRLTCLETWLKAAWPVWIFDQDKTLIYLMAKIIFRKRAGGGGSRVEVRCLRLMLDLCDKGQRKMLIGKDDIKDLSLSKGFREVWNILQPKT